MSYFKMIISVDDVESFGFTYIKTFIIYYENM